MTAGMPFYVSPEQLMKDRADFARKGIARGRSIVVLAYDNGIAFVAENPSAGPCTRSPRSTTGSPSPRSASTTSSRTCGSPACATPTCAATPTTAPTSPPAGLANAYAQTLGTVFTQESKPYEVEIVVAEVGDDPRRPTRSTGSPTTARSPTSTASSPWAGERSRSRRGLKEQLARRA